MAIPDPHNPDSVSDPTPASSDETRPREHLANERTLLAWARTAITFIALGFGVSRFDVFLRELRRPQGEPATSGSFSAAIGLVFVLAGLVTGAAGMVRFFQARDQIEAGRFEPRYWAYIVLTGLLCAVSLALIVYLIVDVSRS